MPRVLRREAARRDLVAQWVWYAENVDVETADRFLAAVEETLRLLAAQPEAGPLFRSENLELAGLRRFPVSSEFGGFLVFYFPVRRGIDLVRVVHGNRDIHTLMQEGYFG